MKEGKERRKEEGEKEEGKEGQMKGRHQRKTVKMKEG